MEYQSRDLSINSYSKCRRAGIELVATNDIHYTYAEDAKPHDILFCIQTGKKL